MPNNTQQKTTDVSDFIIQQRLECVVDKQALDKLSLDELVDGVKPKGNWGLVGFSTGGDEVFLSYVNEDHADRFV